MKSYSNKYLRFSLYFFFFNTLTALLGVVNIESINVAFDVWKINPLVYINLILINSAIARNLLNVERSVPILIFWLFEYIFFGFTIFSISIDEQTLYLNSLKNSTYFDLAIILVFSVHLICFLIEVLFSKKNENQLKVIESLKEIKSVNIRKWNILFYAYLLSMPIVIDGLGGIGFLTRRIRANSVIVDSSRPVLSILEAILYVTPVILVLNFHQNKLNGNQICSRKKIFFLYLLLIILSNPFANARQTTLLLLLPIGYQILHHRVSARFIFVLLAISISFFQPSLVNRQTGEIQGLQFDSPSRLGDFDAFGQMMNTLQFIQMNGIDYLRQFSGSLLFFIPRSYWNEKPLDSGVLIAKFNNLKFQNLSCPWMAEALINGGVLGLLITTIFVTFLLMKVNQGIKMSYTISGFVSSIMFITMRGSLLQVTGKVVFGILIIYFLSKSDDARKSNYRFPPQSFESKL